MMKHRIFLTISMLLILGVLASSGCLGTPLDELVASTVAKTPATIPATPPIQDIPKDTASQRVVLISFHGRYVTAKGAGDGWLLKQEETLSDCGWFTLEHLDNGNVALMTCHNRYVTAPKTGATRQDWMLWQESELGPCGEFVVHNSGDRVALETCADNFLTAGNNSWAGDQAWSIVGDTNELLGWEQFEVLQRYFTPQPVILNFDRCNAERPAGIALEMPSGDSLVVSYVREAGQGCVARLEYSVADWSAYWIQLQGADLSPYSQLVFDVKADPDKVPKQVTLELKRAERTEVAPLDISGITTDWQRISVNLSDFADILSSFTDIEELVFKFDADKSGSTGVLYLDNITLR